MLLGAIFEWILGNTFPAVVFGTFGTFWLTFAGTLSPTFAAFASYAQPGKEGITGLEEPAFNASFGFYLLFMGLLCFVYLVCSVRTNVVFFVIFLTLVLAFGLLTGAYWALASDYAGNAMSAHKMVVVSSFLPFCSAGMSECWCCVMDANPVMTRRAVRARSSRLCWDGTSSLRCCLPPSTFRSSFPSVTCPPSSRAPARRTRWSKTTPVGS